MAAKLIFHLDFNTVQMKHEAISRVLRYDSTKPTSELISCPYFKVIRVVVQVASQVDFKCDSFVVVMCLWGEAVVNGVSIRKGETLLVPASENVLYIFGNATFFTATR